MASWKPCGAAVAVLASAMLNVAFATPALATRQNPSDPFAPIDPQNWVNPDNMTWSDFEKPPGTDWKDPSRKGLDRNFNIAVVTVDYIDKPFVMTLPANSTIFNNPQAIASGLKREDVPQFWKDLLNTPGELNHNHTMHEYWMGDSFGKYGVDLTVFGPYQMPSLSYQYGIDDSTGRFDQGDINDGACPEGPPCSLDVRLDAVSAWRRDVGNDTANSYELIFILSAGQDESTTWQEFGEMKFASTDAIPDSFGPPGNSSLPNWAHTRYVNWTSWASASNLWPTAGNGSIVAAESSGMDNFAHELSHLIGIRDNYNNPFSNPPRRTYTGPYSMLSRGEFNGPGGPHSRWQIPPVQGGAMGSLHTMRDKHQLGLVDAASILQISRSWLATSGPVIAEVIARSVDPAGGLMGFNISFDSAGDLSPYCNVSLDALCDGGLYDNYNIEVVDRMGADSFCPDSGVMITKTKNSDVVQPFQWVIDANPQDAHQVDFYLPNGTARYWTIGDYRQLVDALFHAGTNSGSEYEHVDEGNALHLYVLGVRRDSGVLKYTVGVRSTATNATSHATYGVALSDGKYADSYCFFELTNTGVASTGNTTSAYPQDLSTYLGSDIYRISAEVDSLGWKVGVPNTLAHAKFGECAEVKVAVGRVTNATAYPTNGATVSVTVVSESDGCVVATATCKV